MEIIIIAISLAIISILSVYIVYLKKQKHETDYENDITYLNMCIDREIKFYLSIEIESQDLEVIGIETFREIVSRIVERVTLCLSKKYLNILSTYFSQGGLQAYIFQVVFSQVLPYCINNNAIQEKYDKYTRA